jgi:hypothetical protein
MTAERQLIRMVALKRTQALRRQPVMVAASIGATVPADVFGECGDGQGGGPESGLVGPARAKLYLDLSRVGASHLRVLPGGTLGTVASRACPKNVWLGSTCWETPCEERVLDRILRPHRGKGSRPRNARAPSSSPTRLFGFMVREGAGSGQFRRAEFQGTARAAE